MDAVTNPAIEAVVCMKSAQVGWTEIVGNAVGFFMDQDPSPQLVIMPTLDIADAWSKDRLANQIRDTPRLRNLVADPRTRDSGNTLRHKKYPGGHVTVAGANSPAGLASRPIRVVICDETDRYPITAGTEGDPIRLAQKRSTTFWNRKFLAGSTPTIKGASKIEALYEASDQRRFFVPCPDCDEWQTLKWAQVQWPEGEPADAAYICEHCGSVWDDGVRWTAVSAGEWRAGRDFTGTAGFHINEIYSPWVTLADMATNFLEARKLPETLQTFVNTSLAETWEDAGATVEGEPLMQRREEYTADPAPAGVLLVTAGVDVQDDRLEINVVGWGVDEESWRLEYHILRGDPEGRDIWAELDDLLDRKYTTEDDRTLAIEAAAIDSGGHATQTVYWYAGRSKRRRRWAIKGAAGEGRPIWPRLATRTKNKRNLLYLVGVDAAKQRIYGRLAKITEPGPGYLHFPVAYDADYFDQLTAERVVTKYRHGHPYRIWEVKKSGAPNEALDTEVYALAAMVGRNADLALRAQRVASMQADDNAEPDRTKEQPAQEEPDRTQAKPRRRRKRARGYVSNW